MTEVKYQQLGAAKMGDLNTRRFAQIAIAAIVLLAVMAAMYQTLSYSVSNDRIIAPQRRFPKAGSLRPPPRDPAKLEEYRNMREFDDFSVENPSENRDIAAEDLSTSYDSEWWSEYGSSSDWDSTMYTDDFESWMFYLQDTLIGRIHSRLDRLIYEMGVRNAEVDMRVVHSFADYGEDYSDPVTFTLVTQTSTFLVDAYEALSNILGYSYDEWDEAYDTESEIFMPDPLTTIITGTINDESVDVSIATMNLAETKELISKMQKKSGVEDDGSFEAGSETEENNSNSEDPEGNSSAGRRRIRQSESTTSSPSSDSSSSDSSSSSYWSSTYFDSDTYYDLDEESYYVTHVGSSIYIVDYAVFDKSALPKNEDGSAKVDIRTRDIKEVLGDSKGDDLPYHDIPYVVHWKGPSLQRSPVRRTSTAGILEVVVDVVDPGLYVLEVNRTDDARVGRVGMTPMFVYILPPSMSHTSFNMPLSLTDDDIANYGVSGGTRMETVINKHIDPMIAFHTGIRDMDHLSMDTLKYLFPEDNDFSGMACNPEAAEFGRWVSARMCLYSVHISPSEFKNVGLPSAVSGIPVISDHHYELYHACRHFYSGSVFNPMVVHSNAMQSSDIALYPTLYHKYNMFLPTKDGTTNDYIYIPYPPCNRASPYKLTDREFIIREALANTWTHFQGDADMKMLSTQLAAIVDPNYWKLRTNGELFLFNEMERVKRFNYSSYTTDEEYYSGGEVNVDFDSYTFIHDYPPMRAVMDQLEVHRQYGFVVEITYTERYSELYEDFVPTVGFDYQIIDPMNEGHMRFLASSWKEYSSKAAPVPVESVGEWVEDAVEEEEGLDGGVRGDAQSMIDEAITSTAEDMLSNDGMEQRIRISYLPSFNVQSAGYHEDWMHVSDYGLQVPPLFVEAANVSVFSIGFTTICEAMKNADSNIEEAMKTLREKTLAMRSNIKKIQTDNDVADKTVWATMSYMSESKEHYTFGEQKWCPGVSNMDGAILAYNEWLEEDDIDDIALDMGGLTWAHREEMSDGAHICDGEGILCQYGIVQLINNLSDLALVNTEYSQ